MSPDMVWQGEVGCDEHPAASGDWGRLARQGSTRGKAASEAAIEGDEEARPQRGEGDNAMRSIVFAYVGIEIVLALVAGLILVAATTTRSDALRGATTAISIAPALPCVELSDYRLNPL
jgi:hypothetical protein